MTTVLVTGANGFIGSHLVRALLARGDEVRCLVRPTSDLTSLRGLPITLYPGDVREPETLRPAVRGVERVYHLAARLMATSQREFDENNTQGTVNLLRVVAEEAPTLQRFVLVSSQAAEGPGPDATPLDESRPSHPISWYGKSKKNAEEAVRSYAHRFTATIVRPSSVYGERERDISQAFPLVERGLQPLLGSENAQLNMVYVGDVVRGIIAAGDSDATRGRTYFLVHPRALSPRDVVRAVATGLGHPRGIQFPVPMFLLRLAAPFAELIADLTRERASLTRDKALEVSQTYWLASSAAAKRDFGWEARMDLDEGMRQTTAYYLEQNRELREMPLAEPGRLWLEYVAVACALGAAIEVTARLGRFYTFKPGWLVLPVIFGGFGLSLGSLGYFFRTKSDATQMVVGSLGAGAAEMLNELKLLPGASWEFAPGWPLGIHNGILRALLLGTAGGGFLLVLNAIVRELYRRRLRFG